MLELPAIDNDQELDAAMRFQAQEELPMPLEQAVLDHRVLERFDKEKADACACSSWLRAGKPSSSCSPLPQGRAPA